MATLRLENVSKVYPDGTRAVNGASLDAADGEFIAVVGPSGCGKSTLLRMVAGLESATEGGVFIGGRRVNNLEPAERDIAMVFQNYALYPHMSVRRNMSYGLKNRGAPADEIARRVDAAAAKLGLAGLLDRLPKQLSGGQRQRVAMGRAIVRRPRAFLFDEPLSNLDAKLRVNMRLEIRRLQRETGVTSLYVTHDQVEAMTLGDRLALMNAGRIVQIGRPMDLYNAPASVFAAEFIGSPAMNILDAETDGDGRARIASDADAALSGLPAPSGVPVKIKIGVRPQDVKIAADGEDGALPLVVEMVERLGAETAAHGFLGGRGGPIFSAMLPGDSAPAPGDILRFSAAKTRLHYFNAETGERLPGQESEKKARVFVAGGL